MKKGAHLLFSHVGTNMSTQRSKEDLLNRPLESKRYQSRSPIRPSRRSRSRSRSPRNGNRGDHHRRDDSRNSNVDSSRERRRDDSRESRREPSTRKRAEPHQGDGKADPDLPPVNDDPRVGKVQPCAVKAMKGNTGRNTESFDPASTLVRPSMRIVVGPKKPVFDKILRHDDVNFVPNFFCEEDDWSIYYKLIEEMRSIQSNGQNKSEWIPWAEGCHLISQNPTGCPTYESVLKRSTEYFNMKEGSQGTRFNWYRDSSDWKPFHHDSAAYNPHRAKNQNITVGVSFGSERELAFLNAKNGSRIYFPQTNGMLFAFGRDVNINWKHGVNALAPENFCGKGRISIILWGLAQDVVEEEGSPPLLTNDAHNGFDNTREQTCRDFENGNCRFGDKCKFVHKRRGDRR
ncbi:unnamed protein product [Aphanomyces euteiches]